MHEHRGWTDEGASDDPERGADGRPSAGDVTRLLAAVGNDSAEARAALIDLVYAELHGIARAHLAGDPARWLLQTTSIVHEAYLRLLGSGPALFQSRAHFFGAAAEAMRRVLVERIRAARAKKRGGGHAVRPLDEGMPGTPSAESDVELKLDVLALDEALTRLEAHDERMASVVKLRFFAGLDVADVAAALDIAERTAYRELEFAKAWLYRAMVGA